MFITVCGTPLYSYMKKFLKELSHGKLVILKKGVKKKYLTLCENYCMISQVMIWRRLQDRDFCMISTGLC